MNLAVNNLLSRDDDETDEHDDSSEAYIPGGDISIIFHHLLSSFVISSDSELKILRNETFCLFIFLCR